MYQLVQATEDAPVLIYGNVVLDTTLVGLPGPTPAPHIDVRSDEPQN